MKWGVTLLYTLMPPNDYDVSMKVHLKRCSVDLSGGVGALMLWLGHSWVYISTLLLENEGVTAQHKLRYVNIFRASKYIRVWKPACLNILD